MGHTVPTPNANPNPGSRNDRAHARHEWPKNVQVVWFSSARDMPNEATKLKAKDISAGGIALRSHCMVHPGQTGVILLGPGSEDDLIRGLEVRHCRYDTKIQDHIVGCAWIPIPSFLETRVCNDPRKGLTFQVTIARRPPIVAGQTCRAEVAQDTE